MKNLNYIVENFKKSNLFEKIDEHKLNTLKDCDIFYSLRFDSFGMRIYSYLNCLRISKKFGKKTVILWDTASSTPSAQLHHHEHDDHLIFKDLPIKYFNSDKEFIDKYAKNILGPSGKIPYLENENFDEVIKELSELAKKLELNEELNQKIKNIPEYDYGIHVRSGDITAVTGNEGTGNRYWFAKSYFGYQKWFPESLAFKIIKKISEKKKYIASSSKKFLDKISNLENITINRYNVNKKNIAATKLIIDIYTLSKCKNLICTQRSGVAILATLLSYNHVISPEDFLDIEEIYDELFSVINNQHIELNSPGKLFKKFIFIYLSRLYSNLFQIKIKKNFKKKVKI
jgi:hypothetical protein|tara:strand:+ start:1013 stop:2044 length:1032 start_codon:yes stop_codon:yes gene_type:complete